MSERDYECWSLEEADALNSEEVREGYFDGRKGEPKPGPNRSPAYHHGWWAGSRDAGLVPPQPWLKELARQYVAQSKATTHD